MEFIKMKGQIMNTKHLGNKVFEQTVILFVVVLFVLYPSAYADISDNFNDNSMDTSLWSLYQESPAIVWLDESNQRLELRSTGTHNDEYADYYANAWDFLLTDDFSLRIDFKHDQIPPAIPGDQDWDFSVHLGLAKDWDNDVFLEAGYGVDGPTTAHSFFYCATIVDGYEDPKGEVDKVTDYGTLYISYDADNDELYLSYTGYWATNAWVTIPGLLQGEWDASFVFPYIGGWSDGVAIDSGNAYLDNFVVDSGTIVYTNVVPVPVSINISPDTITPKTKSIRCNIWPPVGYDVSQIDTSSIRLEGTILPTSINVRKKQQMLVVKFPTSGLDLVPNTTLELTVNGSLTDETPFEASDSVTVIQKGGKPGPSSIDIDFIGMTTVKQFRDGEPQGSNPWTIDIGVGFIYPGSLDHIDITKPGDSSPFVRMYREPITGWWEFPLDTDYESLAALRADYPLGIYTFDFLDTHNKLIKRVDINYSDIPDEPDRPVEFIYPSVNGQTDISINPNFSWSDATGTGDALMVALDYYGDTIFFDAPVSIDTTSWTPDPLSEGGDYELDVSVINVKDWDDGFPSVTDATGDTFRYALTIEYMNEIEFTTVGF